MALTPEAKRLLAETIRGTAQDPERGLRARLLRAIHDEADRRYRLSVPISDAGLDEMHRRRRERIEAWIDEGARATNPKTKPELKALKDRLLAQAEKEAAATLINRLVLVRQLEALGLSKPAVLTGGWNSKGYREFREFAPALCTNGTSDTTEGYATLLQLLYDELAIDLPGLFGDVGLTRLFAIPAATLRDVVETLDDPELASAWTDDTTLGWVYQYWNDPDREALDAKIKGGGKIEPHEIASKTQMFTERYMVEWLLQNSLGLTWLAMCTKRGWTADAERALPVLDARRAEWRKRREAGEVALDALMPIEGELESHWKYYVPQPIPDDAVANAPETVRSLKILDPACGSGHFLVIAFDLLTALYREEARHLSTKISDCEIAESILENNLHGIDIDPRAIQIAAAGLHLKAKSLASDSRPKSVNLVAPVLQLGNLPANDPAVVHLRQELTREVGIPEELTNRLFTSLAGVDYLGSLLKVDAAIEDAIQNVELDFARTRGQGDFYNGFPTEQVKRSPGEAKATIIDKLEHFLAKHSTSEDLGLRLDGEQLASGVRFVRMAKEGSYDVVVGNPPYQGLLKTSSLGYVAQNYQRGKADLYAAFLERGVELARPGATSAMITIRGWMFLDQFDELRSHFLKQQRVSLIADLHFGAFSSMKDVSVAMTCIQRLAATAGCSVAIRPVDHAWVVRDVGQPRRNEAGLIAPHHRYDFDPLAFEVIDGEPIVYWWNAEFLARYAAAQKLGDVSPVRQGAASCNNTRFLRRPWEVRHRQVLLVLVRDNGAIDLGRTAWVPYIKGAEGRAWCEPVDDVIRWAVAGLEVRSYSQHLYGSYTRTIKNESFYFRRGVAFTSTGSRCRARVHRYRSIFDVKGQSVFPDDLASVCCLMNSTVSGFVLESLNPSISFQVGDANRLPVFPIRYASIIYARIDAAFAAHEAAREPSVEFRRPGPSSWRYAQEWAQEAVDRPEDAVLPAYQGTCDPHGSDAIMSFAVGIVLGRFGAEGEGVLDNALPMPLPADTLFIASEGLDSLDHEACKRLGDVWNEHGEILGEGDDLRTYLRKSFFDRHKKLYDRRPIYFPLSSSRKNFVAFVSIHRWQDDTLSILLADYLVPAKRRLEGELEDLRTARASAKNQGRAERRFTEVQKLLEELNDFIENVTEIADNGPPPPDEKTPKREMDARYLMDLDDGVMVNSAALWPLLEPQWKDPKKWWRELAAAQGKKDYDWSHLAARYFPTRVRKKCHEDPSLAVAHKCFWELHPAKAYAWELRLQDEIRPDFTIDEPDSDAARTKFLAEHEQEATRIRADELKRRARKATKADDESESGPLFAGDAEPEELSDD